MLPSLILIGFWFQVIFAELQGEHCILFCNVVVTAFLKIFPFLSSFLRQSHWLITHYVVDSD